ncbi:MAG: cupin domain-containing protein, partial [archaeon]
SHDFTLMCLAKGTGIESHTSTKSGIVVVLKGKGTFTLLGRKIAMKPGIAIMMPKGAPHSLKAGENLAILLLLFK